MRNPSEIEKGVYTYNATRTSEQESKRSREIVAIIGRLPASGGVVFDGHAHGSIPSIHLSLFSFILPRAIYCNNGCAFSALYTTLARQVSRETAAVGNKIRRPGIFRGYRCCCCCCVWVCVARAVFIEILEVF